MALGGVTPYDWSRLTQARIPITPYPVRSSVWPKFSTLTQVFNPIFNPAAGPDEHAIILTTDYVNILSQNLAEPHGPILPPESSRESFVIEAFIHRVLPVHTEISIPASRLISLMSKNNSLSDTSDRHGSGGTQGPCPADIPPSSPSSHSQALPDADTQVSILMRAGIIARQTAFGDDGSYVFCIPGLGKVAAAVLAGRKDLQALLRRRMYQEASDLPGQEHLKHVVKHECEVATSAINVAPTIMSLSVLFIQF